MMSQCLCYTWCKLKRSLEFVWITFSDTWVRDYVARSGAGDYHGNCKMARFQWTQAARSTLEEREKHKRDKWSHWVIRWHTVSDHIPWGHCEIVVTMDWRSTCNERVPFYITIRGTVFSETGENETTPAWTKEQRVYAPSVRGVKDVHCDNWLSTHTSTEHVCLFVGECDRSQFFFFFFLFLAVYVASYPSGERCELPEMDDVQLNWNSSWLSLKGERERRGGQKFSISLNSFHLTPAVTTREESHTHMQSHT